MDRQTAADLLDNLVGMVDDSQENDYDTALKMGIEALKAYTQPVRHGHWIEPSRYGFWRYVESAYRECDQCHTPVYLAKRMKFCPECGARMEHEQHE